MKRLFAIGCVLLVMVLNVLLFAPPGLCTGPGHGTPTGKLNENKQAQTTFYDFNVPGGIIYWYINSDSTTATIAGWDGNPTSADIPSTVTATGNTTSYVCTVTKIGDSAFQSCTSLTSVTIPSSVTSVGMYVFMGCTNLSSVSRPSALTTLTLNEFCGCSSLKSIDLTNIKVIGSGALSGCTGLTSINIPNSVTEIDYGAFAGCTGLTSINIPNSVTSMQGAVFQNCTYLKNINLPSVLKSDMGDDMFYECSSLTTLNVPSGATKIGKSAFRDCTNLTSVSLPNSITEIDDTAFCGCTRLTSLNLTNNLKKIGVRAFDGCSSLTSIGTLGGVTEIEEYTFNNCSKLASVGDCSNVQNIYKFAFYNCSSLKSISLPGIHLIDLSVFANDTSLSSVSLPPVVPNNGQWAGVQIWDNAFNGCSSLTNINLTKGLGAIGPGVFYGCTSLVSISLPDTLDEIDDTAFRGCTSLTSITIPDSVTKIGNEAFRSCGSLTSIKLPVKLTSIGQYAFCSCSGLSNIDIPGGVTGLGDYAFYNCHGLSAAHFYGNAPTAMGSKVFDGTASGFKVYYFNGASGFSGTWYGYPTVQMVHTSSLRLAAAPADQRVVNNPVALTATYPGSTSPQYKFSVQPSGGAWSVVQDFKSSNTCNWTPTTTGTYNLRVEAHSSGAFIIDSDQINSYAVVDAPNVTLSVGSLNLKATPANSQVVNQPVALTATASGLKPQFRFGVQPAGGTPVIIQEFSLINTCKWTPTQVGKYTLVVEAWIPGTSNANTKKDQITYDVVPGKGSPPAITLSLTASPDKTQMVNKPVTLTAASSGISKAQYKFTVKPDGGSWSIVQKFSTASTCTWTPTAVGTYTLRVEARSGGNTANDDETVQITYTVTKIIVPPSNLHTQ